MKRELLESRGCEKKKNQKTNRDKRYHHPGTIQGILF